MRNGSTGLGVAALAFSALTLGCSYNPYAKFYRGADLRAKNAPNDIEPALEGHAPQTVAGANLPEDSIYMFENGYVFLGSSSFYGSLEDPTLALQHAMNIGASAMVVYQNYRGTYQGVISLPSQTQQTSTYQGTVFGDRGLSTFSGTVKTSSWGVVNIPFSMDRYDQMATFWAKSRWHVMGIYVRELTQGERQDLGRNRGAAVLAVVKGGPAFKADIVRGDIFDTFNGEKVQDARDLLEKIKEAAGKTATVELDRLGNVATLREGSRKTAVISLNPLVPRRQ